MHSPNRNEDSLGARSHRYTVMHDGGVLVGYIELVDEGRGVLVEEDAEMRRDVVHQDVDVEVPVRQLVLVDQADGVTDLVQVQTFLPNTQHTKPMA